MSETPHICDKCRQIFISQFGLSNHLNACRAREVNCVTCDTCGKSFNCRQELSLHIERMHSGPLSCRRKLF